MKSWKAALLFAGLVVLAFAPRAYYVLVVQGYPGAGYGGEMERAAANLVREGTIGNVYRDGSGPSAHVAPAYAYWLAGVYRLCGLQDEAGWQAQALLAALASALGMALLPWVGRRLGLHPGAGLAAAILLALSPANLWIETSGSWEQPFTALALVALLLVFVRLHDAGWQGRDLLAAGLLVGVAALLSPVTLPAAALMLAGEWLVARERRRLVVPFAQVAAIAGLCLAPWIARNATVLGGFVAVRSNFGLELWIGNHPEGNGKTYVTYVDDPQRPSRQWHPGTSRREYARLQEIGELAYMKEKQAQAWHWIQADPARFARLCLARCRYYWFPGPDMWSPNVPLLGCKVLVFGLAGLGGWAGLAYLFGARHPYRWLLLGAILGPALVYLVTHVETRYRYPTFGLTVLLSCHLVLGLARALGRRWRGQEDSSGPGAFPTAWMAAVPGSSKTNRSCTGALEAK